MAEQSDIHLINPEGLPWLLEHKDLEYDLLVIDESSKFKDSRTKRFKALSGWLPKFKRRWILTGTPTPNGLMDLFGQLYILDLGRALGRFITHYRRNFFFQSGFGGYSWTPQPDAFPRILERISPLILQMSAEDYLQMPQLIYVNREVELDTKSLQKYADIEKEFIAQLGDSPIVASTAAIAGLKCRQIANGAVYDENHVAHEVHEAKLDELESLLGELSGAPVLLLYEFDHDRQRIQKRFGEDIPVLGGALSSRALSTVVETFNAGGIPILMGHPASMGHGLNLQGACSHVIWFGIPWNLEHYDQAIARVYRQGQKSAHVFVYHISAKGTLDEDVLAALTAKDKTQQNLLNALKSTTHEL